MINEARAKKIITRFNIRFPEVTVVRIYSNAEYALVDVRKNPNQIKIGIPYMLYKNDGTIVNAPKILYPDLYAELLNPEHLIYQNSEIEEPKLPEIK